MIYVSNSVNLLWSSEANTPNLDADVIIVEDDPYYFLQEGPYTPQQNRLTYPKEVSNEAFLTSLAPSYLR
jgi:aromatic amino acid aminotransferase I